MSSGPPGLWLVIPLCYDVPSFLRLREEIHDALVGIDWLKHARVRFIVVDDSAGADPRIAQLLSFPDVSVMTPPFNLGHQRAIVYGLRRLSHRVEDEDYVLTLDGDGEDRPQDVPRLLEAQRMHGDRVDTVVLARRTRRRESFRFRLLYAAFRVLFRAMTGMTVRSGNFAVQRGWFVRNAIRHPTFDLCYASSLIALRRNIAYVPCPRGDRFAGRSRMTGHQLLIHGIRMMLPFADRVAIRSLVLAAISLMAVAGFAVAFFLAGALGVAIDPLWLLAAGLFAGIAFVALSSFLMLFAGFAQSSAIALQGLEDVPENLPASEDAGQST